jgi:hypothetical protein
MKRAEPIGEVENNANIEMDKIASWWKNWWKDTRKGTDKKN